MSAVRESNQREGTTRERNTTTTSGSTSTTIRARARVIVGTAYADTLGRAIPPSIQRAVDDLFDEGVTPEVIVYAIEEAGRAPWPSWRYALAVVARCERDGIRTAEDIAADRRRHGESRAASADSHGGGWGIVPQPRQPKKVREQLYSQRDYPDEESLPDWMVAEIAKRAKS